MRNECQHLRQELKVAQKVCFLDKGFLVEQSIYRFNSVIQKNYYASTYLTYINFKEDLVRKQTFIGGSKFYWIFQKMA